MCKHYWIVDNRNVETCKYCGAVHDCQPAIDKSLCRVGLERPLREGVYLDKFFSSMKGGDYYLKGSLPIDMVKRLRYNESV